MGGRAVAGPEWCEEDPIFMVNGALIDVTTGFPSQYLASIQGITFELLVPSNVVASVVSIPGNVPITGLVTPSLAEYNGIGQIPVVVLVTVTSTETFQTSTRITGTYFQTVYVSATLGVTTTEVQVVTDGGLQYVPGQSNTTTQVGYNLLGL
jgi:hypothetical protein